MTNSLGFNKSEKNTRVVVAMSGGVDSSVVAALLKKQNYDVIGMTLQLYNHGTSINKKGACCAGQDIFDAKRIAQQMNFPHYVLDYETNFKQSVIDPFVNSYLQGQTPIPCIQCNQSVKFVDLLAMAKTLQADCLATGHYISSRPNENGSWQMFRPVDESKDQSYFLFATTQTQLNFLRFPLGEMTKTQTRKIATEMKLTVAQKSDSQDICFVPQGKYGDLVAKLAPQAARPGKIIHIDGRIIGEHKGIIHFTIGQRRGLGITDSVADGQPLYVIDIDADSAIVLVGPRTALATTKISIDNVNWLGDGEMSEQQLFVRVRSTHSPRPAKLFFENNKATIKLANAEDGLATGQACVFYQSDSPTSRVLGGGWISEVAKPVRARDMANQINALAS